MQINAAINLVVPLTFDADGEPISYAYHTPISREVFEANYRLIAATRAGVLDKVGRSGPRIAALALRDAGKQDAADRGEADGSDGGASALLAEIKRLTTVLVPSAAGYEAVPVDVAIGRNAVDPEDWRDAEAAIVFFTCIYALVSRAARQRTAGAVASALMGSITSLPPTEYAASLRTLTPAETSAPAAPSSVPS